MLKKYFAILAFSIIVLSFTVCTNSSNSKKDDKASNLIAMAMKNDKYGYINTSGEFIIDAEYPLARTFSNGVACINKGGQRNNALVQGALGGEYSFINSKNEPQLNSFSSTSPMSFYNDVAVTTEADNSKALLDMNGKIVARGFSTLGNCEEGLIPAVKESEKKLGFLGKDGKWEIELPYKYFIGPYSEGLSSFTDTDTKRSGFFDKEGKIAIQATFQEVSNFHEGLARVKTEAAYYFITKDNRKAFETEFEFAGDFSEGMCAVQKLGEWGFIDKKGNLVIPFEKHIGVREFSNGLAAFKQQDGKVGYMDKGGKVVVEPIFDNGLSFKNGYAIIEQNGKMGFIDKSGKIAVKPTFTRLGNFVDPNESNPVFKEN